MPWKCFLVEPSDSVRRSLRRYAGGSKCPQPAQPWVPGVQPWVGGYHNVEVVIDPELPAAFHEEGGFLRDDFEGDPRWPARCCCGYEFLEEDSWQVNVTRLYQGSQDGTLYVLRELPVGAMWDAHWLDHERYKGPDGKSWCCMMPGGQEWIVYGSSSNGKPWDVQGTPPVITVSPSIGLGGRYHGFIKGGIVSEDVDGRKYEGVPRTA